MRLGHAGVLGEYEETADIRVALNGLDAYIEVDHLNLIAAPLAQPDLFGDAHIAGTEALFHELQKFMTLDPSQSGPERHANERYLRQHRNRRERGAIRETRNMVGADRREDRERRFLKEIQEVQVEAARVRTTRQRGLREGGSIRRVEQCEQSRDDALDIVGANAELERDLLVGEPASYSA